MRGTQHQVLAGPVLYPVTKAGDDEDMWVLGYLQMGVIIPVLQNR